MHGETIKLDNYSSAAGSSETSVLPWWRRRHYLWTFYTFIPEYTMSHSSKHQSL